MKPTGLAGLLAPGRRSMILAAGAYSLSSFLTAFALWIVASSVLGSGELAASSLLLALGVIGFRALVMAALTRLRARVFSEIRSRGQQIIYRHLLGVGPAISDSRHTGDVVSLATDAVDRVAALGATFVPLALRGLVVPVVVGVMAMFIDLPSGLVIVAALPLVAVSLRFLEKSFRVAGDRLRDSQDRLAGQFLDAIASLETLVLHDAAERHRRYLAERAERVRSDTMGVLKVAQRALIGVDFVYSAVAVVAVTAVVGWRATAGVLDAADAAVLVLLSVISISALVDVVSYFYVGGLGLAAGRRIKELLADPAPLTTGDRVEKRSDRSGEVVVSTASYTYPGADEAALSELSLRIAPGSSMALVGESGSGKSTLAALVLGLRLPDSGTVTIDGVDISRADRTWLAGVVTYVGQETHLFADTVVANLRVARPQASMAELEEACRRARILEVIQAMPEGFDTRLGELGQGISGGEAQRIGIARAFLTDPAVLVLDEATSGLDLETEAMVHDAVRDLMKGRTTLAIAHRLTTVRICDRVAHLENGRIATVRSTDELDEDFRVRVAGTSR